MKLTPTIIIASILTPCAGNLYIPKNTRRLKRHLKKGKKGKKGECTKISTDYGPKSDFVSGQGWIRTFYEHENSSPLKIGVEFSADLLEGWETLAPSDGGSDIYTCEDGPGTGTIAVPCCGHEIVPPFPRSVLTSTWFRHVSVNVNPEGHVPPGIYDVPHIDFHFWTQTNEDRLNVPGVQCEQDMCVIDDVTHPMSCDDVFSLGRDVPTDQLAPCYFNVYGVEPKMSNHLVPLFCAEEFNGGSFSHTFIFPSCYGELCALEPMITKKYFQETIATSSDEFCFDVDMPEAFPEAGEYPTQYCISYSNETETYFVYLTTFDDFPESNGQLTCKE